MLPWVLQHFSTFNRGYLSFMCKKEIVISWPYHLTYNWDFEFVIYRQMLTRGYREILTYYWDLVFVARTDIVAYLWDFEFIARANVDKNWPIAEILNFQLGITGRYRVISENLNSWLGAADSYWPISEIPLLDILRIVMCINLTYWEGLIVFSGWRLRHFSWEPDMEFLNSAYSGIVEMSPWLLAGVHSVCGVPHHGKCPAIQPAHCHL
jgi:hypothetical protein